MTRSYRRPKDQCKGKNHKAKTYQLMEKTKTIDAP